MRCALLVLSLGLSACITHNDGKNPVCDCYVDTSSSDTGDTGETGDTGDTDTADTADTADTDTAETSDTGDTATSDTGADTGTSAN